MTDPSRVAFPAPMDRAVRLGPFPSLPDALKFLAYAAVGAGVAAVTAPILWAPFAAVGLLFAVYQPAGRPLDARALEACRYAWRVASGATGRTAGRARVRNSLLQTEEGHLLAAVRAGGVPVAFQPPAEARRLWEGFRGLLQADGGGLYLVMGVEPWSNRGLLPRRSISGTPADARAKEGYATLLHLLGLRRFRRAVLLLLWEPAGDAAAARRLEARADALAALLQSAEIPAERLGGVDLRRTAERLGWRPS